MQYSDFPMDFEVVEVELDLLVLVVVVLVVKFGYFGYFVAEAGALEMPHNIIWQLPLGRFFSWF